MLVTSENPHKQAQKRKFYGHHVCPFHEILTERLKFNFPKVCGKCFSTIKGLHYNIIAWLLVENRQLTIRLQELNGRVKEIEECLDTYLKP